ncbi:hypothetical protein D3C80_954380 [compost metagenome]
MVELDDVLAHVRFQAFNALFSEDMVHLHLFADHRFALDHLPPLVSADDREDDAIGLVHRFRPVHCHTVAGQVLFQLLEQVGQLGERAGTDCIAQCAQVFSFMGIAESGCPFGHQ